MNTESFEKMMILLHHFSMENEMARSRQTKLDFIFKKYFPISVLENFLLSLQITESSKKSKQNKKYLERNENVQQFSSTFHAEFCYGWFCVQFTCKKIVEIEKKMKIPIQ